MLRELVPAGKLRVGVAYAPAPTPLFVTKDQAGEAHGVARDLGLALGKALDVPVELFVAPTTSEVTNALASGLIDIGFMPADEDRRKRVDSSPSYFVIESTYLVADNPGIKTIADVDHEGITVVGIAGSATERAAAHSLKAAKIVEAKTVDEAMAMMKAGNAQAFALTHDALPLLQPQVPGCVFSTARSRHSEWASRCRRITRPRSPMLMNEHAKSDGTVRRAFDDPAGLNSLPIAP